MYTCSRSYRKNFRRQKAETYKKKNKKKYEAEEPVRTVIEANPSTPANIYLAKYFVLG